MVIFEAISKPLLILHTVAAIGLLGLVTHDFFLLISYIKGNPRKITLQRKYVRLGFISYICTYFIGGIFLYPAFRVHVRALYLDKTLRWATCLFEIKEHWCSVGLAVFIVYYLLSRYIDPKEDRHLLKIYAIFGILLAIIVWYSAISSFLIGSYKSV